MPKKNFLELKDEKNSNRRKKYVDKNRFLESSS